MGLEACPAGRAEPTGSKTSAPGESDDHQWRACFRSQLMQTMVLLGLGVMGACSAAAEGRAYVFGWGWGGL